MLIVGIDTGVRTGIAVWDTELQGFTSIETMTATRAMDKVRSLHGGAEPVMVYIEDARQRSWFGTSGPEKWQGVGSIKRDASMWEGFCKENGIVYKMVKPGKKITKLKAKQFKRICGWTGRTSEHARDAAMIVFVRRGRHE